MATYRKRNKRWTAEVRRKGFYKAKTFDTKIAAQRWALETEQFLSSEAGLVRGKTLADALDRYEKEVSRGRKGERWDAIRINKHRRDDLADGLLEGLTTDHINRWIARQTTSAGTINRDLNLLSSIFTHCVKWKWIKQNPCKGCQRPRLPAPRERRISADEIRRILAALYFDEDIELTPRKQTGYAFLIALETAMRQGEIWGLAWPDIDFTGRYLTLDDTKNGARRDVPLSSRAIELFGALEPKAAGRVFSVPQPSGAVYFRKAVKIAGIENLTFHDSRHEALTRLARKLDVLDLARMVGHRDPRSLMIYYNPTPTEIAERLG